MTRAWTTARSTPAIAAALLLAAPALAHEVGLSRGEYTLEGGVLSAQITFARREVIGLVAGRDLAASFGGLPVRGPGYARPNPS